MNKKVSYIFIGSLIIMTFFLVLEHRTHILGNFQYILFALFISLHLLMHLGHGGHGSHDDHADHKKGGSHG